MIPIGDAPGAQRSFPIVNYILIALNIIVFILELVYGDCFQAAFSTVPYAITHNVSLPIQGCPYGEPSPVYITLLTSMFMHANLLHIGGNMLFLYIFGDNVEDRLGHVWYLVFYLFCGLVASAAQILVDPNSQLLNLGASGAIAGVLGAYLVFFPGAKVRSIVFAGTYFTITQVSAFIMLGLWFVLQLVSGLQSMSGSDVQGGGVAFFAHVGGFVAGALIALALRPFLKPLPGYPASATSYPAWPLHPDLRGPSATT
jgi:membrane associated rhomboid family serine protease